MDWRKSSLSGEGGNCVQVRQDLTAIRDSKNPVGPALRAELADLVTAIKTGHLDR